MKYYKTNALNGEYTLFNALVGDRIKPNDALVGQNI